MNVRNIVFLLVLLLTKTLPANSDCTHALNGESKTEQLINGVREGDMELLKALASTGLNINQMNKNGNTALVEAVKSGNIEILNLLLDLLSDMKVNAGDEQGITPLIMASTLGHVSIFKRLLRVYNIDVNKSDDNDNTPLIAAFKNLMNPTDMEASNYKTHRSNRNRALHIVAPLLMSGHNVDVNAVDNYKRTALMYSVMTGEAGAFYMIVNSKEVHINARDKDGLNALMWAARLGFVGIVKSLVKQFHADLSAVDNEGQNVLDWAFNGGHASTIIFLLDESSIGADLLN